MNLKIDAKFEEKLIICIKNFVKFDMSTRKSPNKQFYLLLLCKGFNVKPKKYRGVIFHDTEA